MSSRRIFLPSKAVSAQIGKKKNYYRAISSEHKILMGNDGKLFIELKAFIVKSIFRCQHAAITMLS